MQLIAAMRNALADAFDNHINTVGTANTAGRLTFQNSGGAAAIVDITVNNPMFGAAATGAVSANTLNLEGNAVSAATLSRCEIRDLDSSAVSILGCGTGVGADFTLSSTAISSGETLVVNGLTITVAEGSIAFGT